jgi:hypothetical protein
LIYYRTIVAGSETVPMKFSSRSNNFIAILIAVLLFAAGFALLIIHEQSESEKNIEPDKVSMSEDKEQFLYPAKSTT